MLQSKKLNRKSVGYTLDKPSQVPVCSTAGLLCHPQTSALAISDSQHFVLAKALISHIYHLISLIAVVP